MADDLKNAIVKSILASRLKAIKNQGKIYWPQIFAFLLAPVLAKRPLFYYEINSVNLAISLAINRAILIAKHVIIGFLG